MFRQLVEGYIQHWGSRAAAMGDIDTLRQGPPWQVAVYMEDAWARRVRADPLAAGAARPFGVPVVQAPAWWDHLIYAFLIENTRIYEIFERVIRSYTVGESLPIPQNPETYDWLRTTEDVFYSYGIPFLASSVVTQIRPDIRAVRRNSFYRLFGMDLNHGQDDKPMYPYEKPAAANRSFASTFETFLREAWRAIENSRNLVGANPTDSAAVADQALRLQNMLIERRGNLPWAPNLAREEFAAVCAMQWLELAVQDDTYLVRDLQATAASPEERLRKIGERVGIPSHSNSHSYFILAPIMSILLTDIEQGAYSTPAGAQTLYLPVVNNATRNDLMQIIDHWSRITGRNMKALPVAATQATVPTAAPTATRMPAKANGGGAPVTARQLVKV